MLASMRYSHASTTDDRKDWAALIRSHQYQNALLQIDQSLKLSPQNAWSWFYRGLALDGLGDSPQALLGFRHALRIDPDLLPAAEAGAQIAYREHARSAQSFLDDVIRLDAHNATAHAMLGVLALEKGNCVAAIHDFDQAGTLADIPAATKRSTELCRAQLSAQNGDLTSASRILNDLHAREPDDPTIQLDLASIAMQEHKAQEVIELLGSQRSAASAGALNVLASAYAEQDRIAEAIATYRDSIALAPKDDDGYLGLATLSMEHQSADVALSVLNAGLNVNRNDARLLVMRGSVYAQTGKNDLAQNDFGEADRLAPNSIYGTLGMGVLLREDGNLEQAEDVLEHKLNSSAQDPVLSFMLADVLVRQGAAPGDARFTRALSLLRTSVRQQPTMAPALALLGKLELKANDPKAALAYLVTAIRYQPNDRTALNQLVATYRRLGRDGDAERVSEQLKHLVAEERDQENHSNRIHLSISGDGPHTAVTHDGTVPPQP